MYCKHCGTENAEGAAFCMQCGASLEPEGRGPVQGVRTVGLPTWWFLLGVLAIIAAVLLLIDFVGSFRFYLFAIGSLITSFIIGLIYLLLYATAPAYRKTVVLAASILLVAGSVVSVPFVIQPLVQGFVGGTLQTNYTYAPSVTLSDLGLTVDGALGSISLRSVETPAYVVYASIMVRGWGDLDGILDDIQWVTSTEGGHGQVELRMPSIPFNFFGGADFQIEVQVSTEVSLNASLTIATGSVSAALGPGSQLGRLSMQTSTGSVTLSLDEATLFAYSDIDLETTTGGIDLSIDLPSGPTATIPLRAQTVTGGVEAQLTLGPDVGAQGTATTSVGSVDILEGKYIRSGGSFETPNLSVATTILALTLQTTTGSIDVG